MKISFALLVFAFVISALAVAQRMQGQQEPNRTQIVPQATPTPAVMTQLPDVVLNSELKRLGGRTIKLGDHVGKVIVIDLFATWCGPCRFEAPVLAELHQGYKDRGVEIFDLSTEDPEASEENVREWVWT